MGQGATAIADKASAGVHSQSFETYDEQHTWSALDEYEGMCIDLGVEAKLSEFHVQKDLSDVLPHWLAQRGRRSPLPPDEFDLAEGSDLSHRFIPCEGDFLLRNAMPNPGTSHLIHGVMKEVSGGMQHFEHFFQQLKVFEKLLQHPGRKERLMATCMEGTPFSEYMPVIKTFSYTLHVPRWSAVATFCSASVKPIGILRRCWNHAAYEAKGAGTYLEKSFEDSEDKRFRPADVAPLLKQGLFRAYLVLIICIHGLGRRLNAWFRGCPCHAKIWKEAGSNAYKQEVVQTRWVEKR